AGTLHAVFIEIRVSIFVDVDKLKASEIDPVGARRPNSVEKIRVEDFERQRNPTASGLPIQYTRRGLSDAMESLFDISDQFLCDRLSVSPVIVGVTLIPVTVWSIPAHLKVNEPRRHVAKPHPAKFRTGRHQTSNSGVTRPVAANMHP